jgi:adenylate kinase family enzyme
VPLQDAAARLPDPPRRVLIAGSSGAGKTTVAGLVAHRWGLPRVELDALHHGANWVPRPEFEADVAMFAAQARWVTEWQYTDRLGGVLSDAADLVVWLDLPRWRVMRQVTTRTVVRRLRGEVLWNGNTEGPLRTIFTDPDHVVRWAWRAHGRAAERVARLLRDRPEVCVVRLRSRAEVRSWLRRQP